MYEGLFLIDNAHASTEWDNAVKHIQDMLQKERCRDTKNRKVGRKKISI